MEIKQLVKTVIEIQLIKEMAEFLKERSQEVETNLIWKEDENENTLVPDDWEYGALPEAGFYCGRLEKDDRLQLMVDLENGGLLFYDAVVVKVEYTVSMVQGAEKIGNVTQWVMIDSASISNG